MNKIIFTLFFSAALVTLSAQNWTPMAAGLLPSNVVIFSISAVGDDVVWAVASGEYYQAPIPNSHRPRILRSSNGGQTWTVKEIEEAAGTISFKIVAIDSLTAWITTQDYGTGAGRSIYKTTDGGDFWEKKLANSGGGVDLNRFPDGLHWLAHNRQATSRSINNGDTWQNTTITGYQTDEYQLLTSGTNMSCTVGDTLWNGTSSGRILRFTNYGETPAFINTTLGLATTIYSIAFQDHEKGLCHSLNISNNNRIARSVNGGSTWTVLPQQPGSTIGWNIAAVPGAPGYYVLASNYNTALGKVAITRNFGDTWTVENINNSLNAVSFTSPNSGWVGAGKITSQTQPAMFKYVGSPLVDVNTPSGTLPGFTISPNPVKDVLHFEFAGNTEVKTVETTLSDQSGRLVFQGTVFDNQLNVSRFPAGIYFLKVETDEGWAVRKVMLE